MGFERKQCRKLWKVDFVSREGFNNNDTAKCRNEFCLSEGFTLTGRR